MNPPTQIILHQQSKMLEVHFGEGSHYHFPFEFLRVFSPSAEVRGHGSGQGTLQTGKKNVNLINLEPAGNYALKLTFDDGHDSGLYSWEYLHQLGRQQSQKWQAYLLELESANGSR